MIWTRVGQEHGRKVWPNHNQEITKCEGRRPIFNQDTILIIEKKIRIFIIYDITDF